MLTITNMDQGAVEVRDGKFLDDSLFFAAADTFVAGTILARQVVSDTIAVTPDGGNTGDFTLTAAAQEGRTLKVGTYVLTAGDLTAGVGPWTLVDPDGIPETITTAGGSDDDDLLFPDLGVTVTVTDPGSGTPFDDADTANLVVSAQSGTPLVPWSPTGTNGAQSIKAVLQKTVTRTSQGSEHIRPILGGVVNKDRLVIDEDGDGDNITAVHLDQLRATGIHPEDTKQLAKQDNQ